MSWLSSVSPVAGLRSGLAACCTTLLVLSTAVLLEVAVSEPGFGAFRGAEGGKILTALVGGNFYAIHLGAFDVTQVETLLSIYEAVPDVVFFPVVVVVLWAFGYRTVSRAPVDFDRLGGAVQGAMVALGYATGTLLTVALFAVLLGPDADLVTADFGSIVLVAGVFYPALCGAGGGLAATL